MHLFTSLISLPVDLQIRDESTTIILAEFPVDVTALSNTWHQRTSQRDAGSERERGEDSIIRLMTYARLSLFTCSDIRVVSLASYA